MQEFQEAGAQSDLAQGIAERATIEFAKAETGDDDSRARANQEIQRLEREVDRLQSSLGPALAGKQLESHSAFASELVETFGDASDRQRLERLEISRSQLSDDVSVIRSLDNAFLRLAAEVWWTQPGAWVWRLERLIEEPERWKTEYARQLVTQGSEALKMNDIASIQAIVLELGEIGEGPDDDPLKRFGGLRKS